MRRGSQGLVYAGSGGSVAGSGATVVGNDSAFGTAATVTNPAGIADGDLVLLFDVTRNVSAPADPAGFTKLYQEDAVSNEWVSCWYKVASSEPASYTLTAGGITHGSALVVLRGVDTVERSEFRADPDLSPPGGTPGGEYCLFGFLACFASSAGLSGLDGLTTAIVEAGNSDQAITVHGYDCDFAGGAYQASADDPYDANGGRSFNIFLS